MNMCTVREIREAIQEDCRSCLLYTSRRTARAALSALLPRLFRRRGADAPHAEK